MCALSIVINFMSAANNGLYLFAFFLKNLKRFLCFVLITNVFFCTHKYNTIKILNDMDMDMVKKNLLISFEIKTWR